ncbi:radical SAM/SPASM domain-containing protein [Desulfovibrio inopinatus]|uniref:radical SAM/SPASM domain-containing protein n=1 Tax=Desulfovibrio inopinatus TaxID=102109 RepID=UPI000413E3AC|nr:radical SAM protein [Desulfovibrio inopinatus]
MQKRITNLTIQWHITSACGNRCRHCYMYDPKTYQKERENELGGKELFDILNRIEDFEHQWNASIKGFALTGGDPLLKPEWPELVAELKRRGKTVVMMGTPETLTHDNVRRLADLGVSRYQLSLDGLETTHDAIRGRGSFARTVSALRVLREHDLDPQVMFTLHNENRDELIPLVDFVAHHTDATRFSFDLASCVGNATGLSTTLSADQLHTLLTAYLEKKESFRASGNPLLLNEKPHLFYALRAMRGEISPIAPEDMPDVSGCLAGWGCVCILADGTVPACRRFPLVVGDLKTQRFEEIFLGSTELKKFRRPQFFHECGACEYYTLCRGCPAVVFGETGDPFAPPSFCFKKSPQKSNTAHEFHISSFAPIPLDTNFQEEHDLIANSFRHTIGLHGDMIDKHHVLQALLLLKSKDMQEKHNQNPEVFFQEFHIELNPKEQFFVQTFWHTTDKKKHERIENALFWKMFTQ